MVKITFDFDDERSEMVLQGLPEAVPEHESVVVMLPLYVPGEPQRFARVRVPLSLQQGYHLVGQLEAALAKARRPDSD